MKNPKSAPRKNKSKDEILAEMERNTNVAHQKTLARVLFPLLSEQETIYDAQTAVAALAGYIKLEIEKKAAQTSIRDLPVDFSKEKDSLIKSAMTNMLDAIQGENAEKAIALLERIGSGLGQYAAGKYMKNPMKIIEMDDFIA